MKNFLIGILVVACLVGMIAVVHARTNEVKENYAYTDIGEWQVESGDTLWEIANFYSDNRHETRKVIDEIYKLNPGLTANLQIGTRVAVPLYDCMDWEYYDGSCDVKHELTADRIEEGRWLVVEVYCAECDTIEMHDIDLEGVR